MAPALYLRGCWYLSALLVASFAMYFLLRLFREKFVYIIAPFLSLLLLGYLIAICRYPNRFTLVSENGFLLNGGVIRAFAVMGCGVFIYGITRYLNQQRYSKKSILCTGFLQISHLYHHCAEML